MVPVKSLKEQRARRKGEKSVLGVLNFKPSGNMQMELFGNFWSQEKAMWASGQSLGNCVPVSLISFFIIIQACLGLSTQRRKKREGDGSE